MIRLEANQRQPENDYRPLYSRQSRVRSLGRVGQIEKGGLYNLRVNSRFVVVRVSRFVVLNVEDKEYEDFVVVDTHTGDRVKISPARFRKHARNLARCPDCHVLRVEMPVEGWPCLECRAEAGKH